MAHAFFALTLLPALVTGVNRGALLRTEEIRGLTGQAVHADTSSRFDSGSTVVVWHATPEVARSGDGMNLMFVTDCTPYVKWLAFNVFASASRVKQDDPITWIRAGCELDNADARSSASRTADIVKRMYSKAGLVDVSSKRMEDFNLGFGVPKALQSFFFDQVVHDYPDDAVIALMEGDMIFLDRLTTHGLAPVAGNRAIAQHYRCCDNLGPPYIMTVLAWKELTPAWSRLAANHTGGGWGGDQVAFAEAAHATGIKFKVYDNFMVSDKQDNESEGWSLVEESLKTPAGDVCQTRNVGRVPEVQRVPTFLHVVRPWSMVQGKEQWGFSKYQVPPGHHHEATTDGILECGMPLFAEPVSTGSLLELQSSKEQRSGWAVCTIIHSLNSMLASYKKVACPNGFNKAKAFKMKVPLQWDNELLPGWEEGVPHGMDSAWMKQCATELKC